MSYHYPGRIGKEFVPLVHRHELMMLDRLERAVGEGKLVAPAWLEERFADADADNNAKLLDALRDIPEAEVHEAGLRMEPWKAGHCVLSAGSTAMIQDRRSPVFEFEGRKIFVERDIEFGGKVR